MRSVPPRGSGWVSPITLWLVVVAYPLWRANALAGSPADQMAHVFIGAPFVALIVPWKYVFQNYVMWPKTK